jgi:hypothetical protein
MIAMHEEVDFIQENGTLTLVDLPPWKNPIFSKWVSKLKHEFMDNMSHTKLNLWQGALRDGGFWLWKYIFALVIKQGTLKELGSLLVQYKWIFLLLDIKTMLLKW